MEQLINRGTRYIGTSNFNPKQVDELLAAATIKPKAIQIELHPYLPQQYYVDKLQKAGMTVEAYAPLGNTNPTYPNYDRKTLILKHPVITSIASARKCRPVQVVLKWNMDRKVVPFRLTRKSWARGESNPHGDHSPRDFKSPASTNSATGPRHWI